MLNIKEIGAAFAFSNTPHLVLSGNTPYSVIAVNPAFCKWSHLSAEKILHQSIVSAPERLTEVIGLSETALIQLLEKVKDTQSAVQMKVAPHLLPDSEVLVNQEGYFLELYPIMDDKEVGYLVLKLMVEINAPLLATSELENTSLVSDTHQSLPLIFDSLADVIFVLEVEKPGVYKFSFANRAFQRTTGLPVDRVVGSYVQDIIPEPSLSMVLEKYQEAIQEQKQVSWLEVSEYPTGKKTAEVSVVPVYDTQGNCLRLVGTVHDITEFKEAEAKQLRLSQDLYQHNRDLQQFTYIVSHNLRAPLANALGLVRHLPNIAPGTDLFQQYVSYLMTSIEKLDTILIDITQILSIRDRQDLGHSELIALADVCRQAGQDLAVELAACGGILNIAIAADFKIQASRAYLYSIFHNLISNAIKYRSLERVLQINVTSYHTAEDEKVIQFSDNGLGFNIDKFGNDIFKLYKRFHENIEGRGIGLFLVKTHLEAIGGNIKVQSELNVGTTFTIYFKNRPS